jgi:hypothetical protein
MAPSRLSDRVNEQDDGIGREFALNPRVDSLFTAVLRGEIRMTVAGMNWLARGSRVVVGRAIWDPFRRTKCASEPLARLSNPLCSAHLQRCGALTRVVNQEFSIATNVQAILGLRGRPHGLGP